MPSLVVGHWVVVPAFASSILYPFIKTNLNKQMAKNSTFPYFMTWTANEGHVFKLPTGGTSTMVPGENMLYFANTDQCLAFCNQLQMFKITDYKIYRNFID